MPELPEVETIRRDLEPKIVGRKIEKIEIFSPQTVSLRAAFFKKALLGRKFSSLKRRGKLLFFKLSPTTGLKSDYLLIHLKMTGQLIYTDSKHKIAGGHSLRAESDKLNRKKSKEVNTKDQNFLAAVGGELPNRHTRAVFYFSGGGRLYFNDLRKFGYLKIMTAAELEAQLEKNYGPEPLTPAFTLAALSAALKNRSLNIKAALLNQKLVAGLGNIYVDEALFAAGISPLRKAGALKLKELKRLQIAINRIIRSALKHRGTTFSDYLDSSGREGNFSARLKVYGRGGESCFSCGQPIVKIKLAGRGTHYCRFCQK